MTNKLLGWGRVRSGNYYARRYNTATRGYDQYQVIRVSGVWAVILNGQTIAHAMRKRLAQQVAEDTAADRERS